MSVSVTVDELQGLNEKITRLNKDNFEVREELQRVIENNTTLSDELDRMTKTLVTLQVQAQTGIDTNVETKKKSRFDRLVDKVKETKDATELQSENDALRAKILQHNSESVRLQAMELNTQQLQLCTREFQMEIIELQEKVSAKDNEISTLTHYRKLLEEQPDLSNFSELSEASKATSEQLEKKTAECAELSVRAQLADSLKVENESLQKYRTQYEHKVGECNDLRSAAERGRTLEVEQEALEQKVGSLTDDLISTKKKLEETLRNLQSKASECATRQEQAEHMGKELLKHEDLSNTIKNLREELSVESSLRKEHEEAACELRSHIQEITPQLATLKITQDEVTKLKQAESTQANHVESLKEAIRMRDHACKEKVMYQQNLTKCQQQLETIQSQYKNIEKTSTVDFMKAIIYECVSESMLSATGKDANMAKELKEELNSKQLTITTLNNDLRLSDQRANDLKSEHKIQVCIFFFFFFFFFFPLPNDIINQPQTRKKETLIKELQSQLRAAANDNLTAASEEKPMIQVASHSSIDHLGQSTCSDVTVQTLQKEETILINKVASMKEVQWNLEEKVRSMGVTIQYLQDDNQKKNMLLQSMMTGNKPDGYLTNSKVQKLSSSTSSGLGGWIPGIPGITSQKQSDKNDKLQRLLQDTLAENIKLQQKLESISGPAGKNGVTK